MAFWQNVLADRVVGSSAASSPGAGWTSVANFPTMVTNARTLNLPLVLLPGTYVSGGITAASGNPLIIIGAIRGTATLQFSGWAQNFISMDNLGQTCVIRDININGNNQAFTPADQLSALIKVDGNQFTICNISGCTIYNSSVVGVACAVNATANVTDNLIYSCDTGIFTIDGALHADRNTVQYCNNNGVLVYTSSETAVSSSIVSNNVITNISNTAGGSGQYGNGVNVYRAGGTKVLNNTIYTCSYTSIRINIAGNCHVVGNHCVGASGDVAVYFEAPAPGGGGTTTTGGICANNTIDTANIGLSIVNSGLYDDGITRRITVSGNQITNVTNIGILAEGGIDIVGNTVETANLGIVLGTNNAAYDLLASGNYIRSCKLGIGYSADSSAKNILINGNLISGYTSNSTPASTAYANSGAIVSVSHGSGAIYTRDHSGSTPNTDYGNSTQISVGPLTVGMNRAST